MAGLITSWSPSRYEKYTTCPRRAKFEIVDRLCPMCFKGKIYGGFEKPVQCDTCHTTIIDAPPLKRGSEIGKSIENFVSGKTKALHPEVTHPKVVEMINDWREKFKRRLVKMEEQIVLDSTWAPTSKFDKKAWFRGRLDVIEFDKRTAVVTDVKTGGVDKETKKIKADAKYDDQLSSYAVSTLAAFPTVDKVRAQLLFVDGHPDKSPIIARAALNLDRPKLADAQKKWEGKVKAMLSDRVMAPRPGDYCRYRCPFSASKGGPCPH